MTDKSRNGRFFLRQRERRKPRRSFPAAKKGQYRIVFETMLILVGIFITSYVITNFRNVQIATTGLAVEDNFNAIANDVIIGLVKISENPSGVIKIDVPEGVAGQVYKITLDEDGVLVTSLDDESLFVARQIFNIGQVNRIIRSEVVSSARVVEIVAEEGTIRIRRGN